MSDLPLVSVLLAARNESADIGRALDAIAAQSYPHDRIQIVVVDGGSTDDTAAIVERFFAGSDFGATALVDNPEGTTPSNLNAGLARCTGEYVCRVDARSLVPHDYVAGCAEVLTAKPEVRVTGGAQVTVPRDRSPRARAIARALNNRYGMGLARYRRHAESGPTDTVYLGAFRTAELRAVGGWDEQWLTNQDFDLNRRMGRSGVVWFDQRLAVHYIPRATFGGLWQQYRRFGLWKAAYWRATGDRPVPRQWLLLAAPPLGALIGLVLLVRSRGAGRAALVVAPVGALVAVDHLGAADRDAPLTVRSLAVVASGLVAVGWWSGVVQGLWTRHP